MITNQMGNSSRCSVIPYNFSNSFVNRIQVNSIYWYPISESVDAIKWKYFLRYWPFVRVIHRSPVDSPHKGHWCWALMFSFICAWTNGWIDNQDAGDFRRHCANYDITVMVIWKQRMLSTDPTSICCQHEGHNHDNDMHKRSMSLSQYKTYFRNSS